MWGAIMKLWIAAIIFNTVTSKEVNSPENHSESATTGRTKGPVLRPQSCTNCSNQPRSLKYLTGTERIPDIITRLLERSRGQDKSQFKRGTTALAHDPYADSQVPIQAHCEPTLKLIHFEDNEAYNPDFDYIPACTRVNRCNGCCGPRHDCLATNITMRQFRVMRNIRVYSDPTQIPENLSEVIMEVEEHRACQCSCPLKPEQCTGKYELDKTKCKCKCQDAERERCRRLEKVFDEETCSCTCVSQPSYCDDKTELDEDTCQCKEKSK